MGRGLIAVVLALAAMATPASAATRVGSAEYIDDDIDLAGPAVVYEEHAFDSPVEELRRLWLARPGRAPRLLASEAPKSALRYPSAYLDLSFAATPSHVAIARDESGEEIASPGTVEETVYTRRQLRGLPLGGGREWRLAACSTAGPARASGEVEVDGDALLAPVSACADEGLAVRLLSQRGAVARTFPDAHGSAAFDVAGPYIAYLDERLERVVVSDWRTGHEAHSVATARDRQNFTWRDVPSLQSDGTLVVASGGVYDCDRKLTVQSPTAPEPRELPVTACDGDVKLASDRIAFFRKRGEGTELVTVDLAGGDMRPVARFGEGAGRGLDFDGRRVAWNTWRCADSIVSIDEWYSGHVAAAPPTLCPAYVVGRSFVVDAKGRVRIPLKCPTGCNVEGAYLEPVRGQGVHGDGGGRIKRRGTLVFQLTPAARDEVRRHGSQLAALDFDYVRPGVIVKRREFSVTLRRAP